MNHLTRLAAAGALMGSTIAFAQSATQSFEVRASLPARTDIRTLCPDVDNALHDRLVKTVQDVAADALIDVRFELRGSRISAVQTSAGPAAYQRMLARAVRGLQCDSREAAPQLVALRVRFVDPFAQPGTQAMATATLVAATQTAP